MKLTLEIPDATNCVFVNYVYGSIVSMSMATKGISTDDLQSGKVIVCEPKKEGAE